MTDIFKLLLEVTLFSSAMILVVLTIKAVLGKHISIRLISVLWMLVLVRLILPITLESPVHLISTTQESESAQEDGAVDYFNSRNPQNQSLYNNSETAHKESEGVIAQAEGSRAESISTPTVFQQIWTLLKAISMWTFAFILWVTGAAILLVKHLAQMIRFSSKVRNCGQMDNAELNNLLAENKVALGIEKDICIAVSGSVDMPVTLGIIKPKILIPKSYIRKIGRTQLSLMIMHELCHIKRNDVFKNYIWLFAKIVHWFNPLVLFAFKAYCDDIEVACDEMVLRHVSEERKYEYSQGLLEAIKLSGNEIRTPAALSFCKDKTKLRERVETMIRPKRKSRTAAVTAVLMASIMVLVCFTTACQPTPEEPVIVQKDALEQSLDSMLQQVYSDTPLEPMTDQKFTVPDMIQDEINQLSTGNTVIIEAEVVCPEFDSINIMSIGPRDFTQQEVDDFIKYFVGDATLYNGEYQDTKEILEGRIIDTQRIMAMTQEQRDAEFGGYSVKELQEELENLQVRYAAAPDKLVQTAVTSELTTDKDGYEILEAYADYGGSDDILIEVFNLAKQSNNALFHIRLRDQSGDGEIRAFDGESEEIAQSVLNDLGIDNVQLIKITQADASNDSDNTETVARLFYELTYNGIPIRKICSLIGENEIKYAEPLWQPDRISFDVSENGLSGFYWSGHGKIGEEVIENVALLPFDGIMEKFEDNIFLQPIWGYPQEGKETQQCSFHITNISLCMVPVEKKDASGEYLLVPAWNFYGYEDISEEIAEFYLEYMNLSDRTRCLMTLSAVDGTLLHR